MADVTRLNLNLHARAAAALERVEARTGDSRTTAVNRAVQIYDVFLDLTARGRLQVEHPDGTREAVTIL